MTGLEIGAAKAPSGEAEIHFRGGWIKSLRFALFSAGGMAVVLGLSDLLQKQPEAFRLLGIWGPWPLVVLVALGFMGKFLSRLSDSMQTAFGALVQSSQQNAEAQTKTAEAIGRLADQGGKQSHEIARLALFAAQEFPGVYGRLDRQDEVLEGHGNMLAEIAASVKSLVKGRRDGE